MPLIHRVWDWLRLPVWKAKSDGSAGAKKGQPKDRVATGKLTLEADGGTATAELTLPEGSAAGGGQGGDGDGGKEGDDAGKKGDGGIGVGIVKVAGAAATGITATGFIAVVGAAVFWIRLNELHLPVTQALSVMPKSELLVQGAQESIVFVAIALVAVLIVYFTDEKGEVTGSTLLVLAFLMGGAILYLFSTSLDTWVGVALAVLAIVLALGCGRIGRTTGTSFWPLALAVFVAALTYSAAVGILVVKHQRFAQAIAILRGSDDTGLTGVYVTATDDKIYYGQSATGAVGIPVKRGLFEVKLEPTTTYAIGPLESQDDATVRSLGLLNQLIANREKNPASPAEPEAKAKTDSKAGEENSKTAGTTAKPDPVETVAAAFDSRIDVHRKVTGKALCLTRYGDASSKQNLGHWWTSCKEADELKTVSQARGALALPGRFQPAYDAKVRAVVPVGTELVFLEGDTGPQCEHDPATSPCGHRYAGGGPQYYLPKPNQANFIGKECTESPEDETTVWKPC
jgi:hypothetical protein